MPLPDPKLDAPISYGSAYAPQVCHRNVVWIIRDPEFPDRAFIGSQHPSGFPRRGPVEASVWLDFDPKVAQLGKYRPTTPVLKGVLYPSNIFTKGPIL